MLNFIDPDQQDFAVTLNQNVAFLESYLVGVVDRQLKVPPSAPVKGLYLFQPVAEGVAAGHEQEIAWSFNGDWFFVLPTNGQILPSAADGINLVYLGDSNSWEKIGLNNESFDADGDGIIDAANDVAGILDAPNSSFYGKNSLGEKGFFTLEGTVYESHSNDFLAQVASLNQLLTKNNPVTATLPANPPENATIAFYDGSGSDEDNPTGFGKHPLTIDPNGSKVQGKTTPLTIDRENLAIALIYTAAAGWRIKSTAINLHQSDRSTAWLTQTADFEATANSANQIVISDRSITATLPANPPPQSLILFYDGAGSDPGAPTGFGKHPLIIDPNQSTIQGKTTPLTVGSENASLELVYHQDTGWRIRNSSALNYSSNPTILDRSQYGDFVALANSRNQICVPSDSSAYQGAIAYLPSDPAPNTTVTFYDGSGSDGDNPTGFGKYPLTINPGTHLLQGVSLPFVWDLENGSISLIFKAAKGWRILAFSSSPAITAPEVTYPEYSDDFAVVINSYSSVWTNAKPVRATLPANPPENGIVIFFDGAGGDGSIPTGFGKHPLTIDPNGRQLQGQSESLVLDRENSSVQLIYKNSSGWRIVNATIGTVAATVEQPANVRELLRNDRIIQVAPQGNDQNDGINNPKRTFQSAIDAAILCDTSDRGNLIISAAAGNYGGFNLKTILGQGQLIIAGAGSSSVITGTVRGKYGGTVTIKTIKIETSENTGIEVEGSLNIGENTDFGTCSNHLKLDGGNCRILGSYQISGNAKSHWAIQNGLLEVTSPESVSCSLIDNPHFSVGFASVSLSGCLILKPQQISFSGSATGIRYQVNYGGKIFNPQGSEQFLPGNIAGYALNGGRYFS